MTSEIKLEVTCVHCLGAGKKQIFPIINKDNLEAKRAIFEEDLFLYRCPHCGHYQRISYECIYYDEKLKFAILLSQDGKGLLKKQNLDLTGYQLRFVKEVDELKEKIIIKENGFDDRIIEIMKHNLRTSLVSKVTYKLLLRDEPKLEFVLLYPDNEILKVFSFSKYEYSQIEKKYTNYLDNDYVVDARYASRAIL